MPDLLAISLVGAVAIQPAVSLDKFRKVLYFQSCSETTPYPLLANQLLLLAWWVTLLGSFDPGLRESSYVSVAGLNGENHFRSTI